MSNRSRSTKRDRGQPKQSGKQDGSNGSGNEQNLDDLMKKQNRSRDLTKNIMKNI